MADRKKVLVVHPYMSPPYGGNGLAAWLLQSLRDEYDVSIACFELPRYDALNDFFGTDIHAESFTHYQVPPWIHKGLKRLPTPQSLLRTSTLERFVKRLSRKHHFDVFISTDNELSFPMRGIQYIHYPRLHPERPDTYVRWYHRVMLLLAAYRWLCLRVGGTTTAALQRNMTLANSSYTAQRFKAVLGGQPRIVFPPVVSSDSVRPWAQRTPQFVCLGRISPEKEVPKVIDIIRRVRERGHRCRLLIVGTLEAGGAYRDGIRTLFDEHRTWLSHREEVSRSDIVSILEQSRYGIHGMVGEPFGMAVAELYRAGCVVFVPEKGGPAEIVGGEPRLIYRSVEEAVDKIDAVLRDPGLQIELHRQTTKRRDLFTAEQFMRDIGAAVRELLATET